MFKKYVFMHIKYILRNLLPEFSCFYKIYRNVVCNLWVNFNMTIRKTRSVTVAMTDKQCSSHTIHTCSHAVKIHRRAKRTEDRFVPLRCVVIDHCIVSVQARELIFFSYLLKARNEHE